MIFAFLFIWSLLVAVKIMENFSLGCSPGLSPGTIPAAAFAAKIKYLLSFCCSFYDLQRTGKLLRS